MKKLHVSNAFKHPLVWIFVPLVVLVLLNVLVATDAVTTITLHPSTTYQTMNGWEATASAAQGNPESPNPSFPFFKNDMYDAVVNELGINRVRLEVNCGVEQDKDYFSMIGDGSFKYTDWRVKRVQMVNDNTNPKVINANGFHFSSLDHRISEGVIPLKQRIEARGEKLYINLIYVCFTKQFPKPPYAHSDPDEYAEFMLAIFLHLQRTYGWVPDAIEIILEPDNVPWIDGRLIGRMIMATQERLAASGYHPDFIAPGTSAMANASVYFDQMIQVPGVLNHLTEISYHRYWGVSDTELQKIANRAMRHNLDTAMLEWWHRHNTYKILHTDLKMGRNSSWQQETISGLVDIDTSNPTKPVVNIKKKSQYTRLYYQYVRRGAVRIEAHSDNNTFDPLAFINTNGHYTVVVKAKAGGFFDIAHLPAGTYGMRYTTSRKNNAALPDVIIRAGEALKANMPRAGVIVVYHKGGEL